MDNNQLKEKVERLESDNAALQKKLDKALEENKELKEKLTKLAKKDQFSTHEGFAFKRGQDGKFEPTGYCSNCKSIMSNTALRVYQCPECKYLIRKCRTIPEVLAKDLNKQSE